MFYYDFIILAQWDPVAINDMQKKNTCNIYYEGKRQIGENLSGCKISNLPL